MNEKCSRRRFRRDEGKVTTFRTVIEKDATDAYQQVIPIVVVLTEVHDYRSHSPRMIPSSQARERTPDADQLCSEALNEGFSEVKRGSELMKERSMNRAEKRRADETISMLEQRGVYIECPHGNSDEPIQLKDCGLFYGDDFTEAALEVYNARVEEHSERLKSLKARMKNIPDSSESGALAVNTGLIWERLAPCMDGFCFDRCDCRSLFDPLDYIVFEGLRNDDVTRVLFLEVKTGGSRLNPSQRQLQMVVEGKDVSMQVYPTSGAKDAE